MPPRAFARTALAAIALALPIASATADEAIDLLASGDFSAWKAPTGQWTFAGSVRLDPENPKRLAYEPGTGLIVNGPTGRTNNLVSKREFGDCEVHVEFLVPKGSNAGVKLEGAYEIQILDSFGVAKPKATDCGGIYPRAELLPKYRYLDEGTPPRINACKAPGEWQTLDITFHAPRFDAEGKKTANARFDKVVLNGQAIHEAAELKTPTGHAWHNKETPTGPLLLQADHGPVAFRAVRVRPLDSPSGTR